MRCTCGLSIFNPGNLTVDTKLSGFQTNEAIVCLDLKEKKEEKK